MSITELITRGMKMDMVKGEAKSLLKEYSDVLETSKPEIVSNLTEFALEEAGIKVERVVVWDQGSIDIDFGPVLND